MGDRSRVFIRRLAALFQRRHLEDDLEAELRSHLEMAVEQNLRKGMTAEDARREALRNFGGREQIKEIYRDQRGLPMIETALQDLRFGLRMLRRSPGFSSLAILCLTLGIGANAAVFSWIEGILFRPYQLVTHQEWSGGKRLEDCLCLSELTRKASGSRPRCCATPEDSF